MKSIPPLWLCGFECGFKTHNHKAFSEVAHTPDVAGPQHFSAHEKRLKLPTQTK